MQLRTVAPILRYLAFAILLVLLIRQNPPTWVSTLAVAFIAATAAVDTLNARAKNGRR